MLELGGSDGHAVVDLQDNNSGKLAVVSAYEHAWNEGCPGHAQMADVVVGICEVPIPRTLRDSIQENHSLQNSVRGQMHLGWC